MNNYQVGFSAAPTLGSIVTGISAAMAMSSYLDLPEHQPLPHVHVREIREDSSASSLSITQNVRHPGAHAETYEVFAKFYGELSAAQKPLEPDFATVLFDNLWDLYAE